MAKLGSQSDFETTCIKSCRHRKKSFANDTEDLGMKVLKIFSVLNNTHFNLAVYHLLEDLAYTDKLVTDIRDQAKKKASLANKKSLSKTLNDLTERMDSLHKELVATTVSTAITGEEKLREKIAGIYSAVNGYQGRPSTNQIDRLKSLSHEVNSKKTEITYMIDTEIPSINKQLVKEAIKDFTIISKEEFLEKEE